jgi:hypothetical protein
MQPHRIQARFLIDLPPAVSLASVVPVFHRWIQVGRTDELLLDVADYRHVHHGPGIILVGHEADYAVDTSGGRVGLRYVRKRSLPVTLSTAIIQAIGAAATGARWLVEDLGLGIDRIGAGTFELVIVDPLHYPNDDANLWGVAKVLSRVFLEAGLEAPHVARTSVDPRASLSLLVTVSDGIGISTYEALGLDDVSVPDAVPVAAQTEGRHEIA